MQTLRKYPSLHYFQGYHDSVSVLLLTLSPESPPADESVTNSSGEGQSGEVEVAAKAWWPSEQEKDLMHRTTLHLIRDNLTDNLDPVMGHLRFLRDVLRAWDSDYGALIEQASPLPFFALSWALTLFSHDLDSFASMQRIFDLVLSHGPAMIIYLCVAILLHRRDQIMRDLPEEEREDPSLLHHHLSQLPRLYADPTGRVQAAREIARTGRKKASKRMAESEADLSFSDPDIFTAVERAEADTSVRVGVDEEGDSDEEESNGQIALSVLFTSAVQLAEKVPLEGHIESIMLPDSVLRTWTRVLGPEAVSNPDWELEDARATIIVQAHDNIVSPDALVLEVPGDDAATIRDDSEKLPLGADADVVDEKRSQRTSQHIKIRTQKRRGRVAAASQGASMAIGVATLAVGTAGVLIMLQQSKDVSSTGSGAGMAAAGAVVGGTAQVGKIALGVAANLLGLLGNFVTPAR